jgi:hypothetical protein
VKHADSTKFPSSHREVQVSRFPGLLEQNTRHPFPLPQRKLFQLTDAGRLRVDPGHEAEPDHEGQLPAFYAEGDF